MKPSVSGQQEPLEDADVMEIVDETGEDILSNENSPEEISEPGTVPEEEAETIVHEEKELVKEIENVVVPEPTKGGHTLPRHLIDAPLTPDDLYDNGKI